MFRKLMPFLAILVLTVAACAQLTPTPPVDLDDTAAEPAGETAQEGDRPILHLATTTSTEASGLLNSLLPVFEDEYGVYVDVVAVGTGQALQLGKDGNADVLMVHARDLEDAFMAEGHGVRREDLMYNDFIIVGPFADPAGIAGMADVVEAMTAIASTGSTFISRGDDSGTHVMELSLWKAAGIEPQSDWYVSSGQGMGPVLTMADEQEGYALTDRATYLVRTPEGTDLVISVEGDERLFNLYGVIAVNPEKSPLIQAGLANKFIDWLVGMEAQTLIGEYGVPEFGSPLFIPDSDQWREAHP